MKFKILGKKGPETVDLNRRKAIRERCMNCSDWSSKEVRNCEFIDCDLYPYRIGKGSQDAKARAMAIRKYCLWCVNDQPREVTLCPSQDCSLWPFRKWALEKPVIIKSLPEKDDIETFSGAKIKSA